MLEFYLTNIEVIAYKQFDVSWDRDEWCGRYEPTTQSFSPLSQSFAELCNEDCSMAPLLATSGTFFIYFILQFFLLLYFRVSRLASVLSSNLVNQNNVSTVGNLG